MHLFFLIDPNLPSQSDMYVPNIYVSVGNDSIKAVTKNLTWNDAKKNCEADKANLASLRNEWSQAYVELLVLNLNAPVWIGLNKNQVNPAQKQHVLTLVWKISNEMLLR